MKLRSISLATVLFSFSVPCVSQTVGQGAPEHSQMDLVPLHFDSVPDQFALYVHTGTSTSEVTSNSMVGPMVGSLSLIPWTTTIASNHFRLLCIAPCRTRLPAGAYRFAIAEEGGRAQDMERTVDLRTPLQMRGELHSAAKLHYWGLGAMGGGLILGGALIATSRTTESDCTIISGIEHCNEKSYHSASQIALGAGVILTGIIVGAVLISKSDTLSLSISPLHGVAKIDRSPTALLPSGAAFSGQFSGF